MSALRLSQPSCGKNHRQRQLLPAGRGYWITPIPSLLLSPQKNSTLDIYPWQASCKWLPGYAPLDLRPRLHRWYQKRWQVKNVKHRCASGTSQACINLEQSRTEGGCRGSPKIIVPTACFCHSTEFQIRADHRLLMHLVSTSVVRLSSQLSIHYWLQASLFDSFPKFSALATL